MNIGVAAHITAASQGGPRYDDGLTSSERRSPDNGIWLCQNCGHLIDSDPIKYGVGILREWKRLSEEAARLQIEGRPSSKSPDDRTRVQFFRQCFDRPAFQHPFSIEGSVEDLDQALADTLIALNTGTLRSRDGATLKSGEGKSYLDHAQWRDQFDAVADLVDALRRRLRLARNAGGLHLGPSHDGHQFYNFTDRELGEWVDATRAQIITLVNAVCREAKVPELQSPERFRRYWAQF